MQSLALQEDIALWPPGEASHERLKGFYTENVVTDAASAKDLADTVREHSANMERGGNFSRLSLRAIVELGSLAALQDKFAPAHIEAVLPIKDSGLGVAYLGANRPDRRMDTNYTARHQRLLQESDNVAAACPPEAVLAAQGLRAQIVNPLEAGQLAPAFVPRYAVFGYNERQTEDLLRDKANTVAYTANNSGTILSTAMAEHNRVHVSGYGDLHMVEITEASTHPDCRGRGLYAAISGHLIQSLMENRDELDVIFGESNLSSPGVIYAARKNARHFNFEDRQDFGIDNPAFGMLPQHVSVADGLEVRPYNDFAVSYIELERTAE
jgi:ribosomal protein S18 acetylase RimI-like enzyme